MKPIRETPRFYDFFPTRSTSLWPKETRGTTRYTLCYTSPACNLGKLALSAGIDCHSTIRVEISLSKARTNFPRIYREEKSENESFDFRTLSLFRLRDYALLCNRIVSLMFALFITDYSSNVFRHRSGKIGDRLAAYAFRYSVQSSIIVRERERMGIVSKKKRKKGFGKFIEKHDDNERTHSVEFFFHVKFSNAYPHRRIYIRSVLRSVT